MDILKLSFFFLVLVFFCLVPIQGFAQNNESVPNLPDFIKKAKQGNVDDQYSLALKYHCGTGVPQDYKEAVKWYKRAAEKGDVDAQSNLLKYQPVYNY